MRSALPVLGLFLLLVSIVSATASTLDGGYVIRLRVNNASSVAYLSSGAGCSANMPPSTFVELARLHQGLATHWLLSKGAGGEGLLEITSASRTSGGCAAVLATPSDACAKSNRAKIQLFAGKTSSWQAVPIRSLGPNAHYLVAVGGKNGCKNRYLGAPKNCATGKNVTRCAIELYPGPQSSLALLVWDIVSRTPTRPDPLISRTGLDHSGPEEYLFTQNAQSAVFRKTVAGEARDLVVVFKNPSLTTTWFTNKPFHATGTIDMPTFVEEFSWAVGVPNVALYGSLASGRRIELLLMISSPSYNATSGELSMFASKLGPHNELEELLGSATSFQLQTIEMVVDGSDLTTGLKILSYGGQFLAKTFLTGGWQFLALTGITLATEWLTPTPQGPTTASQLAAISTELVQITIQLNDVDSQVTAILNSVESAGSQFDSFFANQTIANAVWNSGPASGAPVGSNMMCPDFANSWTSQILFGSTTSLNTAVTNLFDAISGTGVGTGLLAFMFNQAGGQDCSSSGCQLGFYSGSSYKVPSASPVAQVVLALNRFISVQMQGLSACTLAAMYASNSSNGCITNPPIPANFCASPSAMNVPNILNNIYNSITSGLQPNNFGWPGYLWRDFSYSAPLAPCSVSQVTAVDIYHSVMAPAGQLLTSLRFGTYANGCAGLSDSPQAVVYLEGNFASVSSSNQTGSGLQWGTPAWIAPATPTPYMSSNYFSSIYGLHQPQYISVAPVILPAGYYSVGAMLVTWQCSNLPQYTVYGKDCTGLGACKWAGGSIGTGHIMGLQLSAAQVTFNSDGSMSIGAVSNFSNSGDCSVSAFLNGASGWEGPTAGNSYFPEPSHYGKLPPDTTTPFLQVFNSIYPGGNPTYQSSGNNAIANMQFEATDQTPNPSLVAGATIWLKNNAIAIGVITIPSLMNTTIPPPPLPPSSPPLPPFTPVGPATTFTCYYWDQEEYNAIKSGAINSLECTNSGNYATHSVVNGIYVNCGNCDCCKASLPLPPPPPPPPAPPPVQLPPVGPTTKFECYYWSTAEYDAVQSGISSAQECTNAGYYPRSSTINGIVVGCGTCSCCQQVV